MEDDAVTLPDYQTFMRPVLALLADGEVQHSRVLVDAMADEFQLSEQERGEKIPSGQKRLDSRVAWAITYLAQSGLVERVGRGMVKITEQGRAALAEHPERINTKALEAYPAYINFRDRSRLRSTGGVANTEDFIGDIEDSSTPNDLVERAEGINRKAVESAVLQAALKLSPSGFEELVIRLLDRMGYGRAGSAQRTPPSSDGGIDGIISQDPLGLDRIYIQAKRYTDVPVDRPAIHAFAGALLGKQGDRGVFITTSRFTKGAQEEADRINARIELIDGGRLAELLVRYGVGVQPELSVTLYRLDEVFFDSI